MLYCETSSLAGSYKRKKVSCCSDKKNTIKKNFIHGKNTTKMESYFTLFPFTGGCKNIVLSMNIDNKFHMVMYCTCLVEEATCYSVWSLLGLYFSITNQIILKHSPKET